MQILSGYHFILYILFFTPLPSGAANSLFHGACVCVTAAALFLPLDEGEGSEGDFYDAAFFILFLVLLQVHVK